MDSRCSTILPYEKIKILLKARKQRIAEKVDNTYHDGEPSDKASFSNVVRHSVLIHGRCDFYKPSFDRLSEGSGDRQGRGLLVMGKLS